MAENLQTLLNKEPHLNQIFPFHPLISYRQSQSQSQTFLKLLSYSPISNFYVLTSASLPNEIFITFPWKFPKRHLCLVCQQ